MTPRLEPDFRARAKEGWDGEPPDWIEALAEACQASSQSSVARRLGISASQVSQAIAKRYRAPLDRLEQRVRGALMGANVSCPVLGEIGRDRCISEQAKPFTAASSVRTRLHRACRSGCEHSRLEKERA